MESDNRSPVKAKKPKSFKFLHKKDREKDDKDKEEKEEKRKGKEEKKEERKKEREKEKEEKLRAKQEKKQNKKDKKKPIEPYVEDSTLVVFGIPLCEAVDRSPSHDGLRLPLLVRQCIDYVEDYGMQCEGIYRLSGVKSKMQQLRRAFNSAAPVSLKGQDPHVVASLLKQFLRELPEPVLTVDMTAHFEDASQIPGWRDRAEAIRQLLHRLPTPNSQLVQWVLAHMGHIIEKESDTKMNFQTVCIVLSPTMRISHRVLNVFFQNHCYLFGDVHIRRYLAPAYSSSSVEAVVGLSNLQQEVCKQEAVLAHLHKLLAASPHNTVVQERLWESQRILTLLKRKVKLSQREENDMRGDEGASSEDSQRESTSDISSNSMLTSDSQTISGGNGGPVTNAETCPIPVACPVSVPVACPVSIPVTCPVSVPVTIPVTCPVSVPVTCPVSVPVTCPVSVPVTCPVSIPVTCPVSVPVTVPVTCPVSVPVACVATTPATFTARHAASFSVTNTVTSVGEQSKDFNKDRRRASEQQTSEYSKEMHQKQLAKRSASQEIPRLPKPVSARGERSKLAHNKSSDLFCSTHVVNPEEQTAAGSNAPASSSGGQRYDGDHVTVIAIGASSLHGAPPLEEHPELQVVEKAIQEQSESPVLTTRSVEEQPEQSAFSRLNEEQSGLGRSAKEQSSFSKSDKEQSAFARSITQQSSVCKQNVDQSSVDRHNMEQSAFGRFNVEQSAFGRQNVEQSAFGRQNVEQLGFGRDVEAARPTVISCGDSMGVQGGTEDYRATLCVDAELVRLAREEAQHLAHHAELLAMNHDLCRKLMAEREEIGRLKEEIQEVQTLYGYRTYSYDSSGGESGGEGGSDSEEGLLQALHLHNTTLQHNNGELIQRIQEEREAVVLLKARLRQTQASSAPHTAHAVTSVF